MIYIVGSGIIGLSIGYKLIKDGYATEIISANKDGESSIAAAGMLAPLLEFKPYEKDLLGLMIKLKEKWKDFSEELFRISSIDTEYQTNSSLMIGNNQDDLKQMEFHLKKLEFLNLKFNFLTREKTLSLEPNLSRYVQGSFLIKNQDQINPVRLKSSLKKAFLDSVNSIEDDNDNDIDNNNND